MIVDGYEKHSPGRVQLKLDSLVPNLLTLHDLNALQIQWNSGITESLEWPYHTTIPTTSGFNDLNLSYVYTDTTTAASTHGVFVHGSGDYDSDGLNDADEASVHQTDPVYADSDEDDLNDGAEIAAHTDPNNPDSDYDGILDSQDPEVLFDPDLSPAVADPVFNNPSPTEGDAVVLTSIVSNSGRNVAEGNVVAFFDGDPDVDGLYICADFIVGLDVTQSAEAACLWDTSGVTGAHAIYVVVDPNDRIVEENEGNNTASAPLYIKTKADLAVAAIDPVTPEAVAGQTIAIASVISNTGETDAVAQQVEFLEDGMVFGSDMLAILAGTSDTASATWTPTVLGPHLISVTVDSANVVVESDETNNQSSADGYAGFATPLYVDFGATPDPGYSPAAGYGWLPGALPITTWGSEPFQTARTGH